MPAAAATAAASADKSKTYLADYKLPDYFVDNVRLTFDLDDKGLDTAVLAEMDIRPACAPNTPLVLHAEALQIAPYVSIDGTVLAEDSYTFDERAKTLTLLEVPSVPFKLSTQVRIKPAENTELSLLLLAS